MVKKFPIGTFTQEGLEREQCMCLTHGRLSYGPEGRPRYFKMHAGWLESIHPVTPKKLTTAVECRAEYSDEIEQAILRLKAADSRPSQKALEYDYQLQSFFGGRNAVRGILQLARDQGWAELFGKGPKTEFRLVGI